MAPTTETSPAPRADARLATGLRRLAVGAGILGLVVAVRGGVPGLGADDPLAAAATSETAISVTSLEPAGTEGSRVRIGLEIENTSPGTLVVDAGWFRMMDGTRMHQVLDPAGVPSSRLEPGDEAALELEFPAPPDGKSPRVEVAVPDGGVATLLLPPLTGP